LSDTVLDPKNDVCSDSKALASVVSEQKEYQKSENTSELKALLGDEPVSVKEEFIPQKKEVAIVKSEYKSFLEAPEGYYTINITTTEGLDSAKKFVNMNSLNSNDSYVYPFGPEMKSAKIIYGIFKSVKEASLALENLPASVKANKPYIDNISKHQKLYSKYNK